MRSCAGVECAEIMQPGGDIRVGGLPLARLDRTQVVARVFEALAEGRGGWLLTANVDHCHRFAVSRSYLTTATNP